MKKYAVLSLDFEDWYHLDYLKNTSKSDREYSMLDGFDNFQQLITDNKLPASFFILSSLSCVSSTEDGAFIIKS